MISFADAYRDQYEVEPICKVLPTVEYATLEWVDWFKNRRLMEPIGNIPPAEAEANYFAGLEELALAA